MKIVGEGGGYREKWESYNMEGCIIKLYTLIDLRAKNNGA